MPPSWSLLREHLGLFYGSTTGRTEAVARRIAEMTGVPEAQLHDVGRDDPGCLHRYPLLICGIPTWHIGQMQDDWAALVESFCPGDFTGVRIACFGLGDGIGHPCTHQHALAGLAARFAAAGAEICARTRPDPQPFTRCKALRDGALDGLALDLDRHPEDLGPALENWLERVHDEFAPPRRGPP